MSLRPDFGTDGSPSPWHSFTYAYLFALILIACSMLAAYWVATYKIDTELGSALAINTAGKQRMLSQRLGLLAHEIVANQDDTQSSELLSSFKAARQTFEDNHTSLLNLLDKESTSDAVKALYLGQRGIDASSLQFLMLADEFLVSIRTPSNDTANQIQLMQQLVTIARVGILGDLDAVVQQYESEVSQAVHNLAQAELIILCIGLLLLVCEAVFIFHPVVRVAAVYERQLETTNQELMEFSFRMSHDLRSPIASCRGLADIAKDAIEEKDDELLSEIVDRMQTSLRKADILIEDIISVTRAKVINVEPETVDLRALVVETLQGLNSVDGFDDVQFDIRLDEEPMPFVKKFYLQQILENLLSNAIKYSQRSDTQRTPHVCIQFQDDGHTGRLTVDDNGLGIPADLAHKTFGMFMRFHPSIAQGSGLGLYLCAQNAVALGGQLEHESQTPGSRFILTFQHHSRKSGNA